MKTYSVTDIGQKRKMNQDYVYCNEGAVGMLPEDPAAVGAHREDAAYRAVRQLCRGIGGGIVDPVGLGPFYKGGVIIP